MSTWPGIILAAVIILMVLILAVVTPDFVGAVECAPEPDPYTDFIYS
jgi:hypothetical protein